jgi:hypothetical protein
LDRDTQLRHDVVATLQGIVGARLAGVRLEGPHLPSPDLATAALMARPFQCCRGVELVLEGQPAIVITGAAVPEHQSWEEAEGWEGRYAIVATRRKQPLARSANRAPSIDASELPPWRGHVGKTIEGVQVLGERGRGPTVVKLVFLDGAAWIGCGVGAESGDSFTFGFGDGDEILAASERQAQALAERLIGTVLWDSSAG